MKTITPRQIEQLERKWYIVDAKWLTLGRLASKIAMVLRWKSKVSFAPHVDNWDYVIVLNCDKFLASWNKMSDKMYYTHSWYLGWIKQSNLSDLLGKKPEKALELAISGMLPKNRLKKYMLERLKLVTWVEHKYSPQMPEELKI